MGPTWVLSAPDGPHVGPISLAIRGVEYNLWVHSLIYILHLSLLYHVILLLLSCTIFKTCIFNISLKIPSLKLQGHLSVANELILYYEACLQHPRDPCLGIISLPPIHGITADNPSFTLQQPTIAAERILSETDTFMLPLIWLIFHARYHNFVVTDCSQWCCFIKYKCLCWSETVALLFLICSKDAP